MGWDFNQGADTDTCQICVITVIFGLCGKIMRVQSHY